MEWTTSCLDWEDRIKAGRSLIAIPPLFPQEAADALDQFGELQMVDAAGSPLMRDACRPWVMDFVGSVFGAYDAETGRREITEWLLSISKKNGKSTIAAGIMLTALIRNWRESGEFLILAPTIEIANNSFFPARDMVRRNPDLAALMHVQEHYRTITHRETGATLKVVAADNDTVGGKKAIGVLVDELWLFGKRPNAEAMLREATGGLASRPEGFTIYLSTQSDEPPAGVFAQKLSYARDVRDGKINDKRFVPVLYEFPKDMLEAEDYRKPEFFYVTNPNLGASVDLEFLTREMSKAVQAGEHSVRGLLAKHLNVEIGMGLRSDGWSGALFWEANAEESLTLEELIERSEVLCIGIDGGGLDDLLGLAVMGRDAVTKQWLHWGRGYAQPTVFERRKEIAPRLMDFMDQGDLILVEPGQDVVLVGDVIEQCEDSGLLDKIGVDVAGIGAVVDEIVGRKIEQNRIIAVPQGWRMVNAIKTSERKLAEKALRHGGQPIMAWCVGNAKPEPRGNAVIITKAVAGTAKIDLLMATFNAVSLMSDNPKPRKRKHQIFFI